MLPRSKFATCKNEWPLSVRAGGVKMSSCVPKRQQGLDLVELFLSSKFFFQERIIFSLRIRRVQIELV